ncbi:unnamed protein product [Nezara viridula]|uniref:Hydrophobin n=1 Tax=Nezara viridula TaxID=85310 RepID=A0A9P0HGA5_NEZVI|nr:unnamed protein product [Nezara viridula]
MFWNYLLILVLVSRNSGYTEAELIDSPNQQSKDSAINSNGSTAKSECGKEIGNCNTELMRNETEDDSNTNNTSGKELQEPISESKARLLQSIFGFKIIANLFGSLGVIVDNACCADGGMQCCVDGTMDGGSAIVAGCCAASGSLIVGGHLKGHVGASVGGSVDYDYDGYD